MNIWILILVTGLNTPKIDILVNSFDSKTKCEQRMKKMEKFYVMSCVRTTLNK